MKSRDFLPNSPFEDPLDTSDSLVDFDSAELAINQALPDRFQFEGAKLVRQDVTIQVIDQTGGIDHCLVLLGGFSFFT